MKSLHVIETIDTVNWERISAVNELIKNTLTAARGGEFGDASDAVFAVVSALSYELEGISNYDALALLSDGRIVTMDEACEIVSDDVAEVEYQAAMDEFIRTRCESCEHCSAIGCLAAAKWAACPFEDEKPAPIH